MSEEEIKLLWRVLAGRFVHFSREGSRYVQLLANHGVRSGGSLPHPLSQLLGLPVVPGALSCYSRENKNAAASCEMNHIMNHQRCYSTSGIICAEWSIFYRRRAA